MFSLDLDEKKAIKAAFGDVTVEQLIRCRPGMKEIHIPLLPPGWGKHEQIVMQKHGKYIIGYGQQTHVLVIGEPNDRS